MNQKKIIRLPEQNRNVIYSELWTNGVIYVKAMSVLVCMYTPGDLEKFQTTDHSNNMYY